MMKKLFYCVITIAFVLFLATVVGLQVLDRSGSVIQIPDLELQTNNDGQATVTVTPLKSASAGTLEFEIILDTHSVELNEDLIKAAVLIADDKNYTPTAWDGAPPGGHHRKGVLRFAPISPSPKSITLKIRNVGGVAERDFTF